MNLDAKAVKLGRPGIGGSVLPRPGKVTRGGVLQVGDGGRDDVQVQLLSRYDILGWDLDLATRT